MQTELEEGVQWATKMMDHKTGIEKKAQVGERNINVSKVTFVMIVDLYHNILQYCSQNNDH